MKKSGVFLLGVSIFFLGAITGVILMIFVAVIGNGVNEYDNPYNIKGLFMLQEKGSCITSRNIEIFQTLTKGVALAHPNEKPDNLFLLLDNNGKLFYDGEKVKMPAKKCAKQIGVYTYETKAEFQKTVPAVIIE